MQIVLPRRAHVRNLSDFQRGPGFEPITKQIKSVVQNGFTDIKINQTGLILPTENADSKTSFERMREVWRYVRQPGRGLTCSTMSAARSVPP